MTLSSETLRSTIAWASLFFAYELCAHWKAPRPVVAIIGMAVVALVVYLWPIYTLSGTVWGDEQWWHPITDGVILFTLVLLFHLVRHVSAAYLIAVGVAIAAVATVHAVAKH